MGAFGLDSRNMPPAGKAIGTGSMITGRTAVTLPKGKCLADGATSYPAPKSHHNNMKTKHRIYTMIFAKVYPLYIAKAEKKGRKKSEVDAVICWLTGYNQQELEAQLKKQTDFETFFKEAPKLNPSRTLIKGVVCGVRVEDIEEPLMREIRYLDKLVDELAKGKVMEKILRG
jgi:hypothetical protein